MFIFFLINRNLEAQHSVQRELKTCSTLFSHVLASYSVTAPDLQVSVGELPQLRLSGLQAVLQRLHLPLHLLLVLSDGHFQLAQLRMA